MNNFFQLRLAKHQKKMMKYLRYVLNDHFVLVCLFLIGGIGFYYSNWLKTLTTPFYIGGIILSLFWLICLFIGKFATFTQAADIVFLLPKEKEIREYLQHAFRYSCVFPFLFLSLACGFSMPLVVVTTGQPFSFYFIYLFILCCLKSSQLQLKRVEIFRIEKKELIIWKIFWILTTSLILLIGIYGWIWAGLLGAVAQSSIYSFFLWKKMSYHLDWEKMVQVEEQRLHQIYQFINLFTDVPEITSRIKRRRYLDPLLQKVNKNSGNTYFYLYARRFIRGSDFSGLFLRLLFIGGLLIASMDDVYFITAVGMLFIYLIGFQLLPLYNQFRYMTLVQLYPIKETQKKQAIQKLLFWLLIITAGIFGLIGAIVLDGLDKIIPMVGYLLLVSLFIKIYLPTRIKKMME
ncbi:ABC transporter permease [Enterococcus villorum]|uniref:ABC transporter n=2 Tax=Enterococcus villorum TaxID=112904 RepID=A0A511J3U3_9ENTE|nr:ABC transporter permease [Enterococcus villorum]EOH92615.1 ABC transporter EcsB [Enterococcus villorum ATCC 700913]EOW75523.1 ABC transporter EcsB [Enterococcus villorum ATCC 700913]GEL92687.1 ABC transporter [Enterococcus villorum]